jgi:hypothetical protein
VVKFLQVDEGSGRAQLVMVLTAKDMLALGGREIVFEPEREIGKVMVEVNGKLVHVERVCLLAAPDEESILRTLKVGRPPFTAGDRVVVRASGAAARVGSISTYPTTHGEKPQWKVGVQFDATGERAHLRADEIERAAGEGS